MSENEPVITVTPTLQDGTVVRWHWTLSAAEIHQPTVSASRYGVMVHNEYLTNVPAEWIGTATAAYEQLRRNRGAEMKHLATHRHDIVSNGPLVPVERTED